MHANNNDKDPASKSQLVFAPYDLGYPAHTTLPAGYTCVGLAPTTIRPFDATHYLDRDGVPRLADFNTRIRSSDLGLIAIIMLKGRPQKYHLVPYSSSNRSIYVRSAHCLPPEETVKYDAKDLGTIEL